MKKIISLITILLVSLILTGCGNTNNTDINVNDGEGVKISENKDTGSNNIVHTVIFEAESYALFFNVYNMDNSPAEMSMTINYNELGYAISITTQMNYFTEDGAQGFIDMINNGDSNFSKIFSNINATQEEYKSYLTASLDITYNNYNQKINGFKRYDNIEKWITDSKKSIDSNQSLYDSYEEGTDYYKENYIGYTIKFIK